MQREKIKRTRLRFTKETLSPPTEYPIPLTKSLKFLAVKEVLGFLEINLPIFTTVSKVVNILYGAEEVKNGFARNNPSKLTDLTRTYAFYLLSLRIYIEYENAAKLSKLPLFDANTTKDTVLYYNTGKEIFKEVQKDFKVKISLI